MWQFNSNLQAWLEAVILTYLGKLLSHKSAVHTQVVFLTCNFLFYAGKITIIFLCGI